MIQITAKNTRAIDNKIPPLPSIVKYAIIDAKNNPTKVKEYFSYSLIILNSSYLIGIKEAGRFNYLSALNNNTIKSSPVACQLNIIEVKQTSLMRNSLNPFVG